MFAHLPPTGMGVVLQGRERCEAKVRRLVHGDEQEDRPVNVL